MVVQSSTTQSQCHGHRQGGKHDHGLIKHGDFHGDKGIIIYYIINGIQWNSNCDRNWETPEDRGFLAFK